MSLQVFRNLTRTRKSEAKLKDDFNLKIFIMFVLEKIKKLCNATDFTLTDFALEKESKEYDACNFKINALKIHFRKAKITPKKEGQFVTFWKRIESGVIAPFEESDHFDFLIVEITDELQLGYFVFSKAKLISRKIVSTEIKEGKRAFRVYPSWSIPKNKQALASQNWQMECFVSEINLKSFSL